MGLSLGRYQARDSRLIKERIMQKAMLEKRVKQVEKAIRKSNAPMVTSAMVCLQDAKACMERGMHEYAHKRLDKAQQYLIR
jgi:hypothetical protein